MVKSANSVRAEAPRARAIPLGALVLLSLLMTSGVLSTALLPSSFSSPPSSLGRDALPFALLSLLTGIYAAARRGAFPRGSQLWNAILIGLIMFVAPIGLAHAAGESVPGFARTALFCLVPVFTVVFEPYVGVQDASQSSGGLFAALVAVAGALCVFPIDIPASLEAGAGICATIAAAACIAYANCRLVAMSAEIREYSAAGIAPIAAISGATAALCLGAASAFVERPLWNWEEFRPQLLWSTLVDLPALLLLFWLATRMSAIRMATRYLIAPVLAILLGALAMQAPLQPRTWLGLLMMVAGDGYLMFAGNAASADQALSLKD